MTKRRLFLVVTNEGDITSDYVILELQKRGRDLVRLNTERIPSYEVSWQFEEPGKRIELKSETDHFDLHDVVAAYFRRPGLPIISDTPDGEGVRTYCGLEWQALLGSVYAYLEPRWLNSPRAIAAAEDKPMQLSEAAKLDFRIPRTLLSNSATAAKSFLSAQPSVAKPLRTALVSSPEGERVIFTNRLNDSLVLDDAAINAAPVLFQAEIVKTCDVRVTIVGDRVFAAEINSQQFSETQTDWRRGSRADLAHSVHDLPIEISKKCVALAAALGLQFGAIDLILDCNGEYWFLEINPNGQWAWIESRTGLPIAAAIVDELEAIANS